MVLALIETVLYMMDEKQVLNASILCSIKISDKKKKKTRKQIQKGLIINFAFSWLG